LFHFLCISDHNALARGRHGVSLHGKNAPRPIEKSLAEYRERFGDEWVEIHGEGEGATVRLKTLEEFRGLVEEPGRFLLIESEEITTKPQGKQVHVNALNVAALIPPDIEEQLSNREHHKAHERPRRTSDQRMLFEAQVAKLLRRLQPARPAHSVHPAYPPRAFRPIQPHSA